MSRGQAPGTQSVAPDPTLTSSAGASATAQAVADGPPPRFGYRWTIVAVLFFATTINYVDRQVLGILAPT